jgi:CheY-like chemotaxis protein
MNDEFSGLKVLLVEDNDQLRRIMGRSLESLGCEVIAAANAADALTVVRSGRLFDLLLSDIRMPGDMDGVELADSVRAQCPTTRVLLQTGFYENQSTEYLTLNKPFSMEELTAALRSATRSA